MSSRKPCEYFLRGHCKRGAACPFMHRGTNQQTQQGGGRNSGALLPAPTSIRPGGPGGASTGASAAATSGVLVTMLRLTFEHAGVQNTGDVLDLSNFAEYPALKDVKTQIDFNTVAFCAALAKVITDVAPERKVLRINGNGIRNLVPFLRALKEAGLTKFQAISATDNQIAGSDFINMLRHFDQLLEVDLRNNPVTAGKDYRTSMRKSIQNLMTLDGENVQRPPLALPWAVARGVTNPTALNLLGTLANEYFGPLEQRGPDACISLYAEDAIFSLSVAQDAELKGPQLPPNFPKRSDVASDFASLRLALNDRSRNIVVARGAVRAVRGRTDIAATLRQCLYRREVAVSHHIASPTTVAACELVHMGPSVVCAVVTIHGTISWRHEHVAASPELAENPNAIVSRCYDRTMVLAPNATSPTGMLITNDCLHLRSVDDNGATIWLPDRPGRIEAMGRRYNIEDRAMREIVRAANSDAELHALCGEVSGLRFDHLAALMQLTGNSLTDAILIARFQKRYAVAPEAVWGALTQCGGDVAGAKAVLGIA